MFFFPKFFFPHFFSVNLFFFFSVNQLFSGRHTTQKQGSHHSIIPWWIYRIPSELRSQAPLGLISTAVGDHAGILGVECFFSLLYVWRLFVCFFFLQMAIFFSSRNAFFGGKTQALQNAPPNVEEKKKKQTGKPRLNLTRSLQQGNSR